MSEAMFIDAIRSKFRYPSAVGNLTTEDLFALPLTTRTAKACLDDTARRLARTMKDEEDESFVTPKSTAASVTKAKLEIVKFVIAEKLEEREAAKMAKEKKAKREKILAAIERKEDEELGAADLDDLKKMLENL